MVALTVVLLLRFFRRAYFDLDSLYVIPTVFFRAIHTVISRLFIRFRLTRFSSCHLPVIDLNKVAEFHPSSHVLSRLNDSAASQSNASSTSVELDSSESSWLIMEIKQVGFDLLVSIF